MKKILITISFVFAFALLTATPSFAKSEKANGPAPKINICHKEGGTGTFHLINVSENAKPAHMAHGDGLPGGLVPGTEDKKFSDECTIGDVEKEWTLLETIIVPANFATATVSSHTLANGEEYKLVADGTWENSNNSADAEYISKDGWITQSNGYDISPYFLGEGAFDLQVDSTFINWGSYTATHIYDYMYTGNGTPVSFLIFDGDSNIPAIVPGWYGDNSGSLTVRIYQ